MDRGKKWKVRVARIGNIVTILMYIFMIAIPNYYISTAELPEKHQLNISEGTVVLKRTGKKVYRIGVHEHSSDKKLYFSCARAYTGSKIICAKNLGTSKHAEKINGKRAKIYWYEQPIFSSLIVRRRMVIINIEGEEMLSYEDTREDILSSAKWAPFDAGLLLMIILYFEQRARGLENEQ